MKRLPIARAEFKSFTDENFCYVDKTPYIKMLNEESAKYFFLSRPRRFGKSLFVDTMRAAYAGEKELFGNTFLENNWDWNVKYPVITVSFGAGSVKTSDGFKETVNFSLNSIAFQYNVEFDETKLATTQFRELIDKLYKKFNLSVVILIDEYDKPILDNITNGSANLMRDELAAFYSVLKDMEKYLKFVFLTGVSKFSKTSIFSKLNNITDISLSKKYADICGYTQTDLETVFTDYLHNVDLIKLKDWYDGYNFLGEALYNPYSILLFLESKEYDSFWFDTGTPTFLMKLLKQKTFYLPNIENSSLTKKQMGEFDIDQIDLSALLFQTGYLSIKSVQEVGFQTIYGLSFPNKEVRFGFNDYLLRMFYTVAADSSERSKLYLQIYYAITENKPQDLEKAFKTFFSCIPYDWYRKNDIAHFEGFYSSMFYAFFAAQGFDIIPEDFTNKGRIDLTVKTETAFFIFEFKMKTNTKNALEQIKERKYHEKYLNLGKEIFLIGIEFDEEVKNISAFESEKL